MDHLEIHPELRVFVLEGMVAVGGGHEDLLYTVLDKGLDVFPGQLLEEVLIACLADTLATAVLLFS